MNSKKNPFLLALIPMLFLMGCEFEVPVADSSLEKIDERLLGLWEIQGEDTPHKALILKLSETEYLIEYPLHDPKACFFRGTLTKVDGTPVLQMLWIGTAEGNIEKEKRKYALGTYDIKNDRGQLRLLNTHSGLISTDVTSSQDIIAVLRKHRDNPDLFADPHVFKKL